MRKQVRIGVSVNILAFHAGAPGSTPGCGTIFCIFVLASERLHPLVFETLCNFASFVYAG
jgi:hypothetical protein